MLIFIVLVFRLAVEEVLVGSCVSAARLYLLARGIFEIFVFLIIIILDPLAVVFLNYVIISDLAQLVDIFQIIVLVVGWFVCVRVIRILRDAFIRVVLLLIIRVRGRLHKLRFNSVILLGQISLLQLLWTRRLRSALSWGTLCSFSKFCALIEHINEYFVVHSIGCLRPHKHIVEHIVEHISFQVFIHTRNWLIKLS